MEANATVSILHISDLHFSPSALAQQQLIIDPFTSDIESLFSRYGKPDLIVFSGDLVHNPDQAGSYDGLLSFVLDLCRNSGLPEDRIILCPGNHDVSFATMKSEEVTYNSLQSMATDQAYIEKLAGEGKLDTYLSRINAGFSLFQNYSEIAG